MAQQDRQQDTDQDKHPKHDKGVALLNLILQSQTWVHRRVDALRLDSEGTTRRHVSIDMTAPGEFMIAGSEGRFILPLAVLEKGVKRRLDATQGGKSISVLGREDNGALAIAMLESALVFLLDLEGDSVTVARSHLTKVVYSAGSNDADTSLAAYKAWFESTKGSVPGDRQKMLDITNSVIEQLAHNFLLFVELDCELLDTRTIVKYALNQEAPQVHRRGYKLVRFDYQIPDFGFAASQHVEIEVPAGLMVSSLEIIEAGPDDIVTNTDFDASASGQRLGHVALNPSQRFYKGRASVEVVPAEQGLFVFTKLAVVSIAVMVVLAQLVRMYNEDILGPKAEIPSPSASILLIGPALLFSWMSRNQEHNLVVELLSPLRRVLALCALVLLGTAVLAAIPVTPPVWWGGWFVIGLLTAAAVFGLIKFDQGDELPKRLARAFRRS
ncbi:hypothetical protein [Arthrobacter sp. HMWF013]|uniref:hypothetical protein n=1 Tax=Arthrobacter sp. HMWF013 TaxID=2056849 RepID=UPI000D3ABC6A|nr:hypothetical protein [Arthrobacter sp. HMWF013]PTT70798.1 hypothetical protein DBR22_00260 [Arthrobacter sp. HMWF013]